jgi:preprotein translocase subunit SecG
LLVFFVIVAILLILLVLVQNEEGDSLGGIFAGGSGSAFGSRSGNVLTKATTILGALFLTLSLGMALLNRSPGTTGVEAEGFKLGSESPAGGWLDQELNPQAEDPADPWELSPGGAPGIGVPETGELPIEAGELPLETGEPPVEAESSGAAQ